MFIRKLLQIGLFLVVPASVAIAQQPQVSWGFNANGEIILCAHEEVAINGVLIASESANLISPHSSEPFHFFLSANPNMVVMASLGQSVVINGTLNTGVRYRNPPPRDLQVVVGIGGTIVYVPYSPNCGDGFQDFPWSWEESVFPFAAPSASAVASSANCSSSDFDSMLQTELQRFEDFLSQGTTRVCPQSICCRIKTATCRRIRHCRPLRPWRCR